MYTHILRNTKTISHSKSKPTLLLESERQSQYTLGLFIQNQHPGFLLQQYAFKQFMLKFYLP